MKKTITKLTPLTGLVAGVITLAVAVVGGYFEPGFDHRVDFLSELNDADSRYPLLIGYLGLVPAGMLTLIFLWRLKDEIELSTRSIAGLMFIALIGIDLLVTHFAPCDAGCPVSGNISLSQQIHNISGGLGSVLVPIGIYLLIKPLRKAGFGAAMSAISVAAIAVLVCGFVVMVSNVVPEYIGIVQRANIGAFYIYLTLLSMRLFARTRIEHSAPSASCR